MLYESDNSMQEEPEPDHDGEGLLGDPLTTSLHSNGNRKSQEIFTIQIAPDLSGSGHFDSLNGKSKRSSGYVSLNMGSDSCDDINDEDDHDEDRPVTIDNSETNEPITDQETSSLPGPICSRSSSKSNITIFKINKTICAKNAKMKHSRRPSKKRKCHRTVRRNEESDSLESDIEDSDDAITLTSRSRSSRFAVGYDPGGSGFLSMWSATYSELMYEYPGVSWDCCVAIVIAFCASAQCRAYTQAMKMAAWFTIVVLVFLCFKRYYYGTSFHGYEQDNSTSPSSKDIKHERFRFMDIRYSEDDR